MRTPKNRIFKALVVLALLVLLLINSRSITSSLRLNITDISAPFLKSIRSASSAIGSVMPMASLARENRLLRDRINLLSRKIEESKIVYEENNRLKSFIDFRKTIPYTSVPAQVIGRDPTNWSNSLIIDKGAFNGIRHSKAVLSTKGLVGRVVETGRYSSKVLLITDPNSKVGVLIQRNRQGGILVGRPDGSCKVVYISLDSDVAAGDRVITAGFGSVFPKDILVGEVVSVGKEPGRLYKYAIVKTSTDLSRLEEVLCIR